jgi:hypothetical protein
MPGGLVSLPGGGGGGQGLLGRMLMALADSYETVIVVLLTLGSGLASTVGLMGRGEDHKVRTEG